MSVASPVAERLGGGSDHSHSGASEAHQHEHEGRAHDTAAHEEQAATRGHEHGGAAHDHGSHEHHGNGQRWRGSHHHASTLYPPLGEATVAQVEDARRLLDRSRAVGARRFPTVRHALAAGYVPHPNQNPNARLFHVEQCDNWLDRRVMHPHRPESLVYLRSRGDGEARLVAMMYRAPVKGRLPSLGGPILYWHDHPSESGGRLQRGSATGLTRMTHVWLTQDLKSAYARRVPGRAIERIPEWRGARVKATARPSSLTYKMGACWEDPPV
jgi:hypothetical protein